MLGRWGATLRGVLCLRGLADVAVAAGLWLLLAGSLQLQEVAAALLVGVVVAVVGVLVREEVEHDAAGVRPYLRTLGRQYLGAHRDCWTLTRALLRRPVGRPPAGRLRAVPFDFGGADGEDVGRRVVAILGTSLQPNSYVLGFDRDRDLILVHELVADGEELVPAELCTSPDTHATP